MSVLSQGMEESQKQVYSRRVTPEGDGEINFKVGPKG